AQAGTTLLTGSVFDDTTGLPAAGSAVTWTGVNPAAQTYVLSTIADSRGRYEFNVQAGTGTVRATQAGSSSVDRTLTVVSGQGQRLQDARLTPVAVPLQTIRMVIGGSLVSPAARLDVPPVSLAADTDLSMATPGPQGLQGILVPGWAPVGAA